MYKYGLLQKRYGVCQAFDETKREVRFLSIFSHLSISKININQFLRA